MKADKFNADVIVLEDFAHRTGSINYIIVNVLFSLTTP
jgi:hypothetical protein